jgi:seryl-tRNA synthetase
LVNVFASNKKKDLPIEDGKQVEKQGTSEVKISEQPAAVIQKLKEEEAQLICEKRDLVQLKEQLQKKIKDQIENGKNNVQKLREEVDELKAECAELNESLESELLTQ